MYLLIVSVFTYIQIIASAPKEIPSYFPRCYRNDPKLNECLLKATETMKPYLMNGIPEIGIPPFEDLYVEGAQLQQGTQAINVKAALKDIHVLGLRTYNFTKFDFDVPKLEFNAECSLTDLFITGDYVVTGKILVVPIEGHGKFRVNCSKIDVTVFQKVNIATRNKLEYLNPVNTTVDVRIRDAKVDLQGLFDGNQELAKATNNIINDNIHELFKEIKPVLEEIIGKVVENLVLSAILRSYPYAKLYPKLNDS